MIQWNRASQLSPPQPPGSPMAASPPSSTASSARGSGRTACEPRAGALAYRQSGRPWPAGAYVAQPEPRRLVYVSSVGRACAGRGRGCRSRDAVRRRELMHLGCVGRSSRIRRLTSRPPSSLVQHPRNARAVWVRARRYTFLIDRQPGRRAKNGHTRERYPRGQRGSWLI